MNNNTKRLVAIIGIGLALMMPINRAFAQSLEQLSAEWEQWSLSIPKSVNPLTDTTTGEDAVVGQRGPVWFLAGVFGGGTAVRNVLVPEGTALFFPVINSVQINSPNVGQGPENIPVKDLRSAAASFINGATNLSVTVDEVAIRNLQRVKSEVFAVALPGENVFDAPADRIYSPSVDDGFYVLLNPLSVGKHTLHFHAERPNAGFTPIDVTYNFNVVQVLRK
jgi:hypothetical protein